MPISSFDPVTEQTRYERLLAEQEKEKDFKNRVDPVVAARVAEIYRKAPYIPASVILAMAKSGTSEQTIDGIRTTAAIKTARDLDPQKPKRKGWFQENIYDNVKAASRWTFAALNLLPDLAQNVASQAFSSNDEAGFDGWFKSTQLGTLMSNTQEAGEGWFLGDTAMEKQAERARRVRGTINGSAWTIGRGAAQVAFTPGSKPYSLLSGFVDAAVLLGTDPTLYAGKALKTAKTARAIIPGVSSAEDIENASRLARGTAGLDSAEGIAFQASDFGQFVLNDPRAQRLTARLVENAADTTKTVEEKTLFIIENWKGISPAKAKEFAEATDEAQVLGLLGEASARLSNNTDDLLMSKDIRDIRLAKKSAELSDEITERSPVFRSIRNSRWFEKMPKGSVVINGTGQEKTQAILSYARYLRGVGLSDETPEFKKVMEQVVSAYSSTDPAVARAASKQAYEEAFKVIARHAGLKTKQQQEVIDEIISAAREASSRIYSVDEFGKLDDGGMFQILREMLPEGALNDFTPDQWDNLVLSGPSALNELTQEIQILPDFRRMRALGSNPFIGRGVSRSLKTGEQRSAAIVAEYIQQDIWKPLALATGGYVIRNGLDAQTRMAMFGFGSIFRHPQDYIMWVLRRKGRFDITGEDFGGFLQKNWNKEQKDFWGALTFDQHKNLKDPMGVERSLLRGEGFGLAARTADAVAHTTGYVDNLAMLGDDPINGPLSRFMLEGLDKPQRKERILGWLNEPEQKDLLGQLRDYFSSGIEFTDPGKLQKGIVKLEGNIDDIVVEWVDKLSEAKINNIVRNNEALGIASAYNRVPLTVVSPNGRLVPVQKVTRFADDIDPDMIISGNGGVGSIIRLGDDTEGVILRKDEVTRSGTDPFTGQAFTPEEQFIIQPVHSGTAFTGNGLGTEQLRALIDDAGDAGELANFVKRAERGVNGQPVLGEKFEKARSSFVDFFFVSLYSRTTQFLEKSPVFRQAYYREVFENADLLAPDQASILLQQAATTSKAAGMSIERYLGGKKVFEKLKEVAESTSTSAGTVEQLDDYAKAIALNTTKELLYNATERSNLEDVMRIVVPFGAAWKEVLGTYVAALAEDPTRIRKAQLIVTGGERTDMGIFGGQEGQGFFYKDATTGEYSFNFPLSGSISKLLTGQDVAMQAPLKRISIGLGVVPSIGPMAQIAASRLIPDTPSADFISSFLLPYGKKTNFQVVPMWATRAIEAIEGNTSNLQSVYGNTYIETLRALSASGEYDLSNFDDQEKLYADARRKAQIITGLRVLGQFLGPTSPSPEFKIETLQGDMYGTQLVKEFQKLQSENYDTAVKRFLEIYGDSAILYLSNKTESVAGGLEATDDFGDWERGEGKGLINKYRDVAGFMAPGGDDFSFEVWSRQIEKGLRRRLTDREIVNLAQYRVAASQYRELRDKLPAKPSADQKRWLREWRKKLNQEYPGFPVVAEFNPGEFPKKIDQLTRLVQESALADNDIAKATKTYLAARRKAIDSYVRSGGSEIGFQSAERTAPLRDWLVSIGKALKEEVPEFARIYDRLLSTEVEE
jgi:RimJ/RimL family protein N-acetyltransferase